MKTPSLLGTLLAMSIPACTEVDLSKGTVRTLGDSHNFTMNHGADTVHWDDMHHSVLYDAAGRMIGNISASAAEVLISRGVAVAVKNGTANSVQMIAAMAPPTTQKFVSRKTNRSATPTPKP